MLNAAHLNLTFSQKSSFPLGLVWVVFKNTGLGGGRPRCPSLIIFGEVHHLPLALALRWVEGQLDHPCPRGGGDTHQVGVVPAAAAATVEVHMEEGLHRRRRWRRRRRRGCCRAPQPLSIEAETSGSMPVAGRVQRFEGTASLWGEDAPERVLLSP